MKRAIAFTILATTLLANAAATTRKPAPEALVVIAYVSTLRCQAQHPALRKRLAAALTAWQKRNKKYVTSAKKMINFKALAGQYKSLRRHDKRFTYQTCARFIHQLRDPANDVKHQIK